MTNEQIKLLKDEYYKNDGTGKPIPFSTTFVFDNGIVYNNTDDFIIFDTNNQLIHRLFANSEDPAMVADVPFKIGSNTFDSLQYVESILTRQSFETVIDDLFLKTGLINEAQKKKIMEWAATIQNIIPKPDNMPYFDEVPGVIQNNPIVASSIPKKDDTRSDGLSRATTVGMQSVRDPIYTAIINAFNDNTNVIQLSPYEFNIRSNYKNSISVKPITEKDKIKSVANTITSTLKSLKDCVESVSMNKFEEAKNLVISMDDILNAKENTISTWIEENMKFGKTATLNLFAKNHPIKFTFYINFIDETDPMSQKEFELSIYKMVKNSFNSSNNTCKCIENTGRKVSYNITNSIGVSRFVGTILKSPFKSYQYRNDIVGTFICKDQRIFVDVDHINNLNNFSSYINQNRYNVKQELDCIYRIGSKTNKKLIPVDIAVHIVYLKQKNSNPEPPEITIDSITKDWVNSLNSEDASCVSVDNYQILTLHKDLMDMENPKDPLSVIANIVYACAELDPDSLAFTYDNDGVMYCDTIDENNINNLVSKIIERAPKNYLDDITYGTITFNIKGDSFQINYKIYSDAKVKD